MAEIECFILFMDVNSYPTWPLPELKSRFCAIGNLFFNNDSNKIDRFADLARCTAVP